MTQPLDELTPKGQNMLKEIWAEARAIELSKLEAKALEKTPASAEYVIIEAVGKAEELGLLNRGWELIQDNSYHGGVYKAWVRKATLKKLRKVLDAEVHAVV
jgi:hypothetical protein